MRFPAIEQLSLPCRFERVVEGALHPDGRRYLPLIVLRPLHVADGANGTGVTELGIVDRHHMVDSSLVGQVGVARVVFLLSTIRIQAPPYRQGLARERDSALERPSTRPIAYGRVTQVLAWESETKHLPYQALYAELLLDVGVGVVGVRTSATAQDLAATIGKARVEANDWLTVGRSRIDILGFTADEHVL